MPVTSKIGMRVETRPEAEFEAGGSDYAVESVMCGGGGSGSGSSLRTDARGNKGCVELAMLAVLLLRARPPRLRCSNVQRVERVSWYGESRKS